MGPVPLSWLPLEELRPEDDDAEDHFDETGGDAPGLPRAFLGLVHLFA